MRTFGWDELDIERSMYVAGLRIGGECSLYPNNMVLLSENSRAGKCSFRFALRFNSHTERLKDGCYPPGVLVRPHVYRTKKDILDPIPMCELTGEGGQIRTIITETHSRRSCGVPCYHAHGHFYRALFENNSEGRISTAYATYLGMEGFNRNFPYVDKNIGSHSGPLQYSEACDCHLYGVEDF